eukprot:scaffold1436_cov130-Skeletonema_marinoi.AAC.2
MLLKAQQDGNTSSSSTKNRKQAYLFSTAGVECQFKGGEAGRCNPDLSHGHENENRTISAFYLLVMHIYSRLTPRRTKRPPSPQEAPLALALATATRCLP